SRHPLVRQRLRPERVRLEHRHLSTPAGLRCGEAHCQANCDQSNPNPCSHMSLRKSGQFAAVLKALPFPSSREGWTRPQENIAEGILMTGADGVVRNISDHPVCASKVASQLFLIAQPPLVWRRGLAAANRFFPLGNAENFVLFLGFSVL